MCGPKYAGVDDQVKYNPEIQRVPGRVPILRLYNFTK